MMKKTLLTLSVLFLLTISSTALAQGFVPLAEIPGLTDTRTATSIISERSLAIFFNNLYKYCLGLAAVLAVIMITWGGLRIATNQDNVSVIIDSKGKIYNAIYGLILVLSPVLVFSIINPAILNLSVGLAPIEFTYAPVVQTQTTAPYTLPSVDQELRESHGGTVLYAFTVDLIAAREPIWKILDAEQDRCTAAPGGPGVILPVLGGATKHVCQTCPPNTTLILFAKGRRDSGAGPRGACQPN